METINKTSIVKCSDNNVHINVTETTVTTATTIAELVQILAKAAK